MLKENEKLLVHLNVHELKKIIEEVLLEEVKKITKVIEMVPTEKTEKKFMTREETATLFQVSLTTLYLWNKQGILKHTKVNSRVYYLASDVMDKFNVAA